MIQQSAVYSSIMSEKLAHAIHPSDGQDFHNTRQDDSEGPSKRHKSEGSSKLSSLQPSILTGATLHDYQLEGVAWLKSLYENGLNGILADDMGLGKTIQTIAFLSHLIEGNVSGIFLIISPLATLDHWQDEFKRYAPSIHCHKYRGDKMARRQMRKNIVADLAKCHSLVMVTTYETIIYDIHNLKKFEWKYVVVDEGHRIKNMNSVLLQRLKQLSTSGRLLLSGTPLQNNLAELWTLLNFLLPDIFSDLEVFESWFINDSTSIPNGDKKHAALTQLALNLDPEIIGKLHDILRPFLLRRLKSCVLRHLPPKREYTIYTNLTPTQLSLYEQATKGTIREFLEEELLKHYDPTGSKGFRERDLEVLKRFKTINKLESSELSSKRRNSRLVNYKEPTLDDFRPRANVQHKAKTRRSSSNDLDYSYYRDKKMDILSMPFHWLHTLRMICDSPFLLKYPFGIAKDERLGLHMALSGKMQLLDDLCRPLIARGHRILVFSQYLEMLDILEEWAREIRQWKSFRIDGGTAYEDRQQYINTFNTDDEYKIFFLSTRSGGVGINLPSADTVILFDSDWNPHCDLQAMDRAYRIGQEKPVIVYRLVTAHTIEQHIIESAARKRQLEKRIIAEGDFCGFNKPTRSVNLESHENKVLDKLSYSTKASENLQQVREASSDPVKLSPEVLETLLDRSMESYTHPVTDLPYNIIPTKPTLAA